MDTHSGCFGSLLAKCSETTGLRLLMFSCSYKDRYSIDSHSHSDYNSRDLVPSVVAAVFLDSSQVFVPWPGCPTVHMMLSPVC